MQMRNEESRDYKEQKLGWCLFKREGKEMIVQEQKGDLTVKKQQVGSTSSPLLPLSVFCELLRQTCSFVIVELMQRSRSAAKAA